MAQNMQDWLARFAAEIGTIPPTSEELDMLLGLAGIAAHASERPAAPITCWLVGRAGWIPGMRSPPVSGSPGTARRRAADAGRRAASVQLCACLVCLSLAETARC